MSVIICHNWYRSSSPSGENVVVAREMELLRQHNICHQECMRYNDKLEQASIVKKIFTALGMSGSIKIQNKLKQELAKFSGYKIFHAHNVLPMFSYDVFAVAKELGFTTIQTLHNYNLIASHKHCYTQNTFEPDQLRKMNPFNRGALEFFFERAYKRVWRENRLEYIDKFICLTEFQRDLFIQCGMPQEKLFIKPNFVSDKQQMLTSEGEYAIFVGRLSNEKGILQLCEAWQKLDIPLYILGSGHLLGKLPIAKNIHYLDQVDHDELIKMLARARFLIMNSVWYEVLPLVLIEALSCGIPCLVPKLGAMPEIIKNGKLGYTFEPQNMNELIEKAQLLWNNAFTMKLACRKEYENKYTPERNIKLLLAIYDLKKECG